MSGEVSLESLLFEDYAKETPRQKTKIGLRKGNIKYVNICKPDTIYLTDTIRVPVAQISTNNFKDQSILQKITDKIKWWWWLILFATIISVGYFIKK